MILYHLARPELLDAIMKEGLVASNAIAENDLTFGRKVVWLLSNIESWLAPAFEFRKLMLKRVDLMTDDRHLPQFAGGHSLRIHAHWVTRPKARTLLDMAAQAPSPELL